MHLIIVESPTKAKTIAKFVGDKYRIESSYGHIRDLPKSKIGIDIAQNFEPQYIIPLKARRSVGNLKKAVKKAEKIILATDEDREGEAIAWHLTQALNINNEKQSVQRIVFHEITKSAIEKALQNPRGINFNLVNAQQARRVLDRLVGYLLSPFLWKKLLRGLSAGRVQSVALRLIVEREEEIKKFQPEEYYTIFALLNKQTAGNTPAAESVFEANLYKINNQSLPKPGIKTKEETVHIVNELKQSEFKIINVKKKEVKRNPLPPFITSTLQQEANRRFGWTAKKTMFVAQRLYEQGFITYMRTDSFNLSEESLKSAQLLIKEKYGAQYLIGQPRIFKTKSRLAQEAHEAVRPTNPLFLPANDNIKEPAEKKLYDLIWRRFIASQMPPAIFDSVRIEIEAKNSLFTNYYLLITNGSSLRFDGFLKVWPIKFEEKELPPLSPDEILELIEVKNQQHFTQPPARYNEAGLIKTLEEYGIGRPSTYAFIISVIQERRYVEKDENRRFQPTEIGEITNRVLTEHFPDIVNVQFTAEMEENLDKVAAGEKEWREVIGNFYEPFAKNLEQKYKDVSKEDFIKEEKTEEICEKCGKPMVIKTGRFGKFLACSGFPECKSTKNLNTNRESFGKCPKCLATRDPAKQDQEGEIIRRRTAKGRFFYGCSQYPKCDFASWKKPI